VRVRLFGTCLADLVYPRAKEAARRVLEHLGAEVVEPIGATCCGQPAWNSGHVSAARRVASGTLAALSGDEPLVVCSGSCTTMLKHHWGELFEGTPEEAAARAVGERASDFASFIAENLESPGGRVAPCTAVYHDSCHMLRALGARDAPRALLARVEGLDLREMDNPERCCGFGGTFSLRYPELSAAMADEKVDDARRQGAEVVCASDLGCLMQITGRALERGEPLEGRYIAEVLDAVEEGT
jgi:L-lactate dehydrogenase complex protein LldE